MLTRLEQKRTGLHQSLVLLIMTLTATMLFLPQGLLDGYWIDAVALVCLVACLFILIKEREFHKHETSLVEELSRKDQAVDHLDRKLTAGRFELVEEKEKADELEGRLKEITTLYRAIHKVNVERNNVEVSHTALEAALELVGGNQGSIMFLDENRQYLLVETSIGIEKGVAQATRQQVGEGVAGWVAKFGEPARISGEAQDDGRFHKLNEHAGRLKSALCIPLKLKNETIGVMNLGLTESEDQELSEYHMSLASIFGEHAALAITCSRLHRLFGDGDQLSNCSPLAMPSNF